MRIQRRFPPDSCPLRTALITARDAISHQRVVRTLRAMDVRLDECFFLGGVAIGRLSKGRTILEPGLAACLAAAVLLLLTGALDRGVAAMLCAAPVLALLAMFGGWLGEKWQGSS